MSILERTYEISLWEDILTFVDIYGNEYTRILDNTNIKTSYFKERKICVIGSNETKSKINIFNTIFEREITGKNVLKFSILSKYLDEETNELVENPFIQFLINERKVKLKIIEKGQIKWYDFIIKNIEENSENYTNTYTATDLFVNELSKTGFHLEFDSKLENNIGTVEQLGEAVLYGTDWKISDNSEALLEFQEEALYQMELKRNIIAYSSLSNKEVMLKEGSIIYAFYSSVVNQEEQYFQFLYNQNGIYETDNNKIIINADNYYMNLLNYKSYSTNFPYIADSLIFINKYRGKRLVRTQKIIYDKTLEKYVSVYEDQFRNELYGFKETEYITEKTVESYISNGKNFVNSNGWDQKEKNPISIITIPSFEDMPLYNIDRKSYLKYKQSYNNFLFNSGINDHYNLIKEVAEKDDLFMVRIKLRLFEEQIEQNFPSDLKFKIQVKTYNVENDGSFSSDNINTKIIFEGFTGNHSEKDPEGYFITRTPLKTKTAITSEQLKKEKIGIFITAETSQLSAAELSKLDFLFEDIQLFRYVLDGQNNICIPEGKVINQNSGVEEIQNNVIAHTVEKYYYYYPEDAESKDKIKFAYIGTNTSDNFPIKPLYTNNKVRAISGSRSNRFNLLQNLSETFECWCKIEVKHKETGEIMLGKDYLEEKYIHGGTSKEVVKDTKVYYAGKSNESVDNFLASNKTYSEYEQLKFISFHKDIGQINHANFVYGINLKSITRKVESEEIVTKLMVESNSNEYAKFGSCNIARAKQNVTGENFIINFDYFINKNLLDSENFYSDMYSLEPGKQLGYFVQLKEKNNNIEKLSEELSNLNTHYTNIDSEYQILLSQYESSINELKEREEYFYKLTQCNYDNIKYNNKWLDNKTVISLCNIISNLRIEIQNLQNKCKVEEQRKKEVQEKIQKTTNELEEIIEQKKILNIDFNKKYSRFIQEGSWNSEEYFDDDLYYLDAEKTMYASSQPKIGYDINVVEISQIEDFGNYSFEIGDITYIQDPDFFGWEYYLGTKKPKKEKIVVTKQVIYFENPEKDTISTQNYRTQFEDLFQRLTAATQQIQYNSGSYDKAASIVNDDRTLSNEVLKKAFSQNISLLQNAENQTIAWDEEGIVSKNPRNPSEAIKITSGGIYTSNESNNNWQEIITGRGIRADTITAGQLNTEYITILNGQQASFRWDSQGINAYYKNANNYYDSKTFVRFDQYGIYGIKDKTENFYPQDENEVWDNANFALTWKGFKLKSGSDKGSVVIDSEKDFNVYDKEGRELIHIGRIDDGSYGIRIKDNKNNVALLATQEGLQAGGWTVEPGGFYSANIKNEEEYEIGLFSKELDVPITIFKNTEQAVTKDDWRIVVGNNFGIDFLGNLYASNANITGTINATGGTIGGIVIKDNQLLIPSDKVDGIEVKDNLNNTLLSAKKVEETVNIAKWTVYSEGLKYGDVNITNIGIESNGKKVTWQELVDYIKGV